MGINADFGCGDARIFATQRRSQGTPPITPSSNSPFGGGHTPAFAECCVDKGLPNVCWSTAPRTGRSRRWPGCQDTPATRAGCHLGVNHALVLFALSKHSVNLLTFMPGVATRLPRSSRRQGCPVLVHVVRKAPRTPCSFAHSAASAAGYAFRVRWTSTGSDGILHASSSPSAIHDLSALSGW